MLKPARSVVAPMATGTTPNTDKGWRFAEVGQVMQ